MLKKGEDIRKRKNQRWERRYKRGCKENDKIIYESAHSKIYQEAEKNMHVNVAAPKVIEPAESTGKMTLANLLQKWQEANAVRLKGGTRTRYENIVNSHIIPRLGNLRLFEISATTVNRFLNEKLT